MAEGDKEPAVAILGSAGWRVRFHDHVASTNDLARDLPPWSAIVATSQSSGRGRLGRAFVSDAGGLWLTAVVPAEPPATRWSGLSLAIGRHLHRTIESQGVTGLRLRWPNDLMVGDLKLGGLLIEQGRDDTLCVGVGLNITNRPWESDPNLAYSACRLADLLSPAPDPFEMAPLVLNAIADAHEDICSHGLPHTISALNEVWRRGPVTLYLYGGNTTCGHFAGLDSEGNILLEAPPCSSQTIPHQNIERFVEEPFHISNTLNQS